MDCISILSYFEKNKKNNNNFFCKQNRLYLHTKLEHCLITKKYYEKLKLESLIITLN
jgi:hypothetical protein